MISWLWFSKPVIEKLWALKITTSLVLPDFLIVFSSRACWLFVTHVLRYQNAQFHASKDEKKLGFELGRFINTFLKQMKNIPEFLIQDFCLINLNRFLIPIFDLGKISWCFLILRILSQLTSRQLFWFYKTTWHISHVLDLMDLIKSDVI